MFTIRALGDPAATATTATPATDSGNLQSRPAATPATTATPVAKVAAVAVAVPVQSDVEAPPLTRPHEAARQEVLARLEAHPSVERAFVTRWEADTLLVTLGIRSVGTGELSIPCERMRQGDLAAYSALLDCLSSQGAAS